VQQKTSNREINARKSHQNKVGQQAIALGLVNNKGNLPGVHTSEGRRLRSTKRRYISDDEDDDDSDQVPRTNMDEAYRPPVTRGRARILSPSDETYNGEASVHSGGPHRHSPPPLMSPFFVPFEQNAPVVQQEVKNETAVGTNDEFNFNNFDFDFDLGGLQADDSVPYQQQSIDPRLIDLASGYLETPLHYLPKMEGGDNHGSSVTDGTLWGSGEFM
jgi:hypothetical protein